MLPLSPPVSLASRSNRPHMLHRGDRLSLRSPEESLAGATPCDNPVQWRRQSLLIHATVPVMLHLPDTSAIARLVLLSRQALGLTQGELASMMRVARRTAGRWEARRSTPSVAQLAQIARAVHPRDAGLAKEIAAETGTTLEALGLAVKALPPSPPPRRFPPVDLMTDSIVFAARQAFEETQGKDGTQTFVAALRAAFARAKGLGLTIEEVDAALTPRAAVKATEGADRKAKRG
jgi:transcriptional regulator with XRE-family HTH domain